MQIRPLTPADSAAYHALRLEALRHYPTAYVTAYEEDAALRPEQLTERLTPSDEAVTFGAFEGESLVGIGTLIHYQRIRLSFRAMIVAMYVTPGHRGQGIAARIVQACLERARTLPGVEEVCLSVTVGNDSARRCYLGCGFVPEYVQPRYFKYEGRYYDIEWLQFPLAGGVSVRADVG